MVLIPGSPPPSPPLFKAAVVPSSQQLELDRPVPHDIAQEARQEVVPRHNHLDLDSPLTHPGEAGTQEHSRGCGRTLGTMISGRRGEGKGGEGGGMFDIPGGGAA